MKLFPRLQTISFFTTNDLELPYNHFQSLDLELKFEIFTQGDLESAEY